jgi:hypothetical protein
VRVASALTLDRSEPEPDLMVLAREPGVELAVDELFAAAGA